LYISRLALDHYRSWNHCVLDLTPGINILQGANGLGKTNIVEAIEVLSTGLSHRTSSSVPLVQRSEHAATIRANIESVTDPEPAGDGVNTSADAVDISDMKPVRQTQTTTLEATIAARGANRARINGGQSRYLREILGTLPTVSFTPEDQQLVAGDPAVRRSFINQVASLLIPGYANRLQSFTHVAKQRAALLKQLGQWQRAGSPIDAALSGLEIWTGQFIEAAQPRQAAHHRGTEQVVRPAVCQIGRCSGRLAVQCGNSECRAGWW
jgi:DNA replication and repair protein RecF